MFGEYDTKTIWFYGLVSPKEKVAPFGALQVAPFGALRVAPFGALQVALFSAL